jgi:hypothetical protein
MKIPQQQICGLAHAIPPATGATEPLTCRPTEGVMEAIQNMPYVFDPRKPRTAWSILTDWADAGSNCAGHPSACASRRNGISTR